MTNEKLGKWIERLKTMGTPWSGDLAPGEPFRDEVGATRPVDGPFFAWRVARLSGAPGAAGVTADAGPDVLLWRALTDSHLHVDDVVARFLADADDRDATDAGALHAQHGTLAIEAWIEAELAAIHALLWHGHARGRGDLAALTERIAQWHLENLQPDNATNRPWGLPVFIWMSVQRNDATAGLYADTMLHNCQVALGHVDRLSAHIMLDAAEALEMARSA